MITQPAARAAAFNAVIAMFSKNAPKATKELNYTPYGASIEKYAAVSDSRKRKLAAAERKAQARAISLPAVKVASQPYNQRAACEDWCAAEFVPLSATDLAMKRIQATAIASYPNEYRPNIGGTKHANACNGRSGNWSSYNRSIAEQGKALYLHGQPVVAAHAQGL